MKKVLSVVIPTYNMEKYLSNCLDSFIYDEKMTDVEVIVVNDGSKDGSLAIAKEYEAKYPNIFKVVDKENGGHGSTINAGLKVASGKYFKVVDSDDWVNTEHFRVLVEELKACDCDAVCANFNRKYELENRTEINDSCKGFSGKYNIDEIHNDNLFTMHSMTYKTENIKDIFILEHCFYVDVLFNLYCHSRSKTVYFIPDMDVYQYRLGRAGQSVSMEGMYKHKDEHTKVVKTAIEYIYADGKQPSEDVLNYVNGVAGMEYNLYLGNYKAHKEIFPEVIEFDNWLKNYPEIYGRSNKRAIKLLRKGKFKNVKFVLLLKSIKNIFRKG